VVVTAVVENGTRVSELETGFDDRFVEPLAQVLSASRTGEETVLREGFVAGLGRVFLTAMRVVSHELDKEEP
jgi:hypothetical protein